MCDKSVQQFIQSRAKESAKSIQPNLSARPGVIGTMFWELPGCRGISRVTSGKVRGGSCPRVGAQSWMVLHLWRNGLDAGGGEAVVEVAHGLCLFGDRLASKGLVDLE